MNYYLKYTISNIHFATPIEEVKEVARPKRVSKRKIGKHVVGIIDLRKKKVPLYDLPKLLDLEAEEKFEAIISEIDKKFFGFKVNKVLGIITAINMFPFPELVKPKRYFQGIIKEDDTVIQVLSLKKIVAGFKLKK
ncbi:MAG: chemotaxis protein CheW [candidate division WOR-3 bacterium]|nr:MAG: chemotaxis protein CheW [candidate division WOR-3 bacterium]